MIRRIGRRRNKKQNLKYNKNLLTEDDSSSIDTAQTDNASQLNSIRDITNINQDNTINRFLYKKNVSRRGKRNKKKNLHNDQINDNQNYDIQIESDEFDNDSDEKSLIYDENDIVDNYMIKENCPINDILIDQNDDKNINNDQSFDNDIEKLILNQSIDENSDDLININDIHNNYEDKNNLKYDELISIEDGIKKLMNNKLLLNTKLKLMKKYLDDVDNDIIDDRLFLNIDNITHELKIYE
jgi:hypothetical protein